jgi:hypothetical protein
MRILFDQGVPVPLRSFLAQEVQTCHEQGWSELSNGDLIGVAEGQFDVFVTTDKNLRYQQNLKDRRIAIIVLPTTRWPAIKPFGEEIARAIGQLRPGEFLAWELPS